MIDVTSSSSKELGLPAERKTLLICKVSSSNAGSASGSARFCLPWRQEDEAKIEVLVLNSSSFILLESQGAFSTRVRPLPLPLTQTHAHARTDDA